MTAKHKVALPNDSWASNQVGLLIASFSQGRQLSRDGAIEALNDIAKDRYDGNLALFARSAGIPKTTFHLWMHKRVLPNLPQLLAVCFAAEVSLLELLCGNVIFFKAPKGKLQAVRVKRQSLVGKLDELETTLRTELSAYPCRSPAKIARSYGVDPKSIRHHFPALARRLAKQAQSHREKEVSLRRLTINRSVSKAGRSLLNRGERLSLKNFQRCLGHAVFPKTFAAIAIRAFQEKYSE